MFTAFTQYIRNKSGSLLPLTAIMMPLLIGMAGVGVDASLWLGERRDLQTAADAAVLAAAWEIANNLDDNAQAAALKEAINNGYDSAAAGSSLEVVVSENEAGQVTVTANIEQKSESYFSKVLFADDVYTAAVAASALVEPAGDFCLLALDETAKAAITTSGSVIIDSMGCGMAINSNHSEALSINGSVDIAMDNFSIVGDYAIKGGSADLTYNTMTTGASKMPDPYEDLEVPDYAGCDYGDMTINSDYTFSPGVYCGDISISGNVNITFQSGTYIIDGGGLKVTGGGTLTGDEVSFVLTSSSGNDYGQIDVSGSKEVIFTAPAEGEEMEGVVFYRDREAPSEKQCSTLTGTSAIVVEGAMYLPTDCLTIGGDNELASPNSSPCTRIIAKTITLSGNPTMDNDCEGTAVEDIGNMTVRLVL